MAFRFRLETVPLMREAIWKLGSLVEDLTVRLNKTTGLATPLWQRNFAGAYLYTNTVGDVVLLADGTVGAPAYSYLSSPTDGMYLVAANNLGFATNGVLRVGIENTNLDVDVPIYAINGAVGAPSYSYDTSQTTGHYLAAANTIGVSTNGVLRQTISTTEIQDVLVHYFVDGAVGAPGIAWAGDALTGFYRIGISDFGVAIGGALDFSFTANTFNVLAGSNITMADDAWIGNGGAAGRFVFDSTPAPDVIRLVDGVLHLPDGAVGAPSLAFTSSTTTGIYYTATQINFAVAGVLATSISGAGGGTITVDGMVLTGGSITDGSGAITFGNENLVTTGTFGSGAITTTGQLLLPDGAVGAPAWAATSETNTGAYFTASTLNWAIDGVQEMILTGTGLQVEAIGVGIAPDATTIGKFYRNDASVVRIAEFIQDGTGDASIVWGLTGGQHFVMGIDNSAGDLLKISPNVNHGSTNYWTMSSAANGGRIGIGDTPHPTWRLRISDNPTNITDRAAIGGSMYSYATANGVYNNYGMIFTAQARPDFGITNTGVCIGQQIDAYLMDTGTQDTLRAFSCNYGNSVAGTTNNLVGYLAKLYRSAGVIVFCADFYAAAASGAIVPTNEWCIYSLHDAPSRIINDLRIASDTYGLKLGAADDSGITYDGTNMVFDSRLVGTGDYLFTNGYIRPDKVWHAYGGFEDQGETITCGVGDWNHITNAGNNLWNLDENDGVTIAADVLTLTNTGDYFGTLSISLSGLNAKDFHVRVYNNTQARVEGRPMGVSTTGANNEVNVCIPIYIEGTAGDAIQFEIMSADGTDPDVDDGMFEIIYLHE